MLIKGFTEVFSIWINNNDTKISIASYSKALMRFTIKRLFLGGFFSIEQVDGRVAGEKMTVI